MVDKRWFDYILISERKNPAIFSRLFKSSVAKYEGAISVIFK